MAILLTAVCFVGFLFMATPTGDDDQLVDEISKVIRTIVTLEPDRVQITVEEDFVHLDGTVESEQQITEIIEAVEPLIGDRELRHELNVAPVDSPLAE